MALLRVDIDKFRRLYAEHGDETVDEVLIWIAQTLTQTARTEDTLARIGGSSFAIMAPGINPGEAIVLGDRLRFAISKRPFEKDNLVIPMTASIGLATLTNQPNSDIDTLLKIADDNLHKARRKGGDAVQPEDEISAGLSPNADNDTATLLANSLNLTPVDAAIDNIEFDDSEQLVPENDLGPMDETQTPHLDEAMASLDSGILSSLEPQLWSLLKRLLPLLEYCDEKLNLGIGAATKVIRHKIENPEEE